jgi:hypothetical protein
VKRNLARFMTRLYPRSWRERYGDEFEVVLLTQHGSIRAVLDVVWSALKEHAFPVRMSAYGQCYPSFVSIMKKPSAIVPMAMSVAALGVVFGHIAMVGVARQADEGGAAHSWQLLMGTQLPILFYFAIKWLPKAPRQTLGVIALQAIAAVAAMAPVFLLRW